jgi:hypothetical protein
MGEFFFGLGGALVIVWLYAALRGSEHTKALGRAISGDWS